jgi:hypothetical protein
LNDEKQAFGKTHGTDFEDKVVLITVQVLGCAPGCAQVQALSSSRQALAVHGDEITKEAE